MRTRVLNTSGLSLLEVVLAIALVSLAVGSLVTISNTAVTGDARSRTMADQYAREGIEQMRVLRDSLGFNGLFTSSTGMNLTSNGTKCYAMDSSTTGFADLVLSSPPGVLPFATMDTDANYTLNTNAKFSRGVCVTRLNGAGNEVRMTIKVTVTYDYRLVGATDTYKKVDIVTELSDWK
jgi:type II secretory pathway pseudopilin PulG